MNEIIIGGVILIIMIAAMLAGRQRGLHHIESHKESIEAEKDAWAEESVLSFEAVQLLRQELIDAVHGRLVDHPEDEELLKQIINDWADLKIESYEERRSWVRSPDQPTD